MENDKTLRQKTMKKIILRIILGLLIIFALFTGLIVVPYFANIVMPWNKTNAIETALKWGGLADIPKTADVISVGTEGGMFTRTFIIEFQSESEEIEQWIKNSKRLKDASYTKNNDIILYKIHPGEEKASVEQ